MTKLLKKDFLELVTFFFKRTSGRLRANDFKGTLFVDIFTKKNVDMVVCLKKKQQPTYPHLEIGCISKMNKVYNKLFLFMHSAATHNQVMYVI